MSDKRVKFPNALQLRGKSRSLVRIYHLFATSMPPQWYLVAASELPRNSRLDRGKPEANPRQTVGEKRVHCGSIEGSFRIFRGKMDIRHMFSEVRHNSPWEPSHIQNAGQLVIVDLCCAALLKKEVRTSFSGVRNRKTSPNQRAT